MRAALIEASEKPLEVVNDIDIEDPRPGEVLVRVSHCGVCHSDLSLTNGTFPVTAPTVLMAKMFQDGQVAGLLSEERNNVPAKEIVDRMVSEASQILNDLRSRFVGA